MSAGVVLGQPQWAGIGLGRLGRPGLVLGVGRGGWAWGCLSTGGEQIRMTMARSGNEEISWDPSNNFVQKLTNCAGILARSAEK